MRWEEMSWDKVRRAQMRWSVECEGCSVKCGARRVQCEVWSVKCEVCSVKCEVWSVKCEVWSVKCEVKCGVRRVQCEVWSVECEAWSVECVESAVRNVQCEVELQMWHEKQDTTFAECTHARAWLAHGACKFYRWERSYICIDIPKATSAPPRAGTTGILWIFVCWKPVEAQGQHQRCAIRFPWPGRRMWPCGRRVSGLCFSLGFGRRRFAFKNSEWAVKCFKSR